MRFSIAHEIGHFVLHAELYGQMKHDSVEEWIKFIEKRLQCEKPRDTFSSSL
jgi:Zn-dependent peptidase ImmA (M78 family)